MEQVPQRTAARIRGVVRARGAAYVKGKGDQARKILNILVQASNESSWYVRERAKEALADLGD